MSASCQNLPMAAAGLLLCGGASRRMGEDKARIRSGSHGKGPSLAQRAADILREATSPVLEVGPGYSGLPRVAERPLGGGPLVALAAGAAELFRVGWTGAAVVIATDMPMLEVAVVEWLAGYPDSRTVVPVLGDVPQPLCARYDRRALDSAIVLAEDGARSMRDLLSVVDHVLAGPEEWQAAGIEPRCFADVDTPGDLAAYRSKAP